MTETGFCKVHGGRIYYEVDGSGPELTLIHAGVANLRQWDEQVPVLAADHRVIRYDTRNFGHTTSDNVTFSNREDLFALLDHLGVAKTAVLGLSRGGSIAVDFTLEHPDRVSALIAVAAGLGGFEAPVPADEQALWEEYERRYEAKDWDWIIDTETAFWVDGPRQPSDRVPSAIRQRVHEWIAEAYRDHGAEELTALPLEPPAAGRLGEIEMPTLSWLATSTRARRSRRAASSPPTSPTRASRCSRGWPTWSISSSRSASCAWSATSSPMSA